MEASMKNTDNRVRYTKMVLRDALLRILKKKHIDRITIKELCDEAEINRGTFYLHYSTPNDLLIEIEQKFLAECMEYFSPYMKSMGSETDCLAGLFAGILRNAELCRVIMGENGNPKFLERIKEMNRNHILSSWQKEFPDYSREDLDYVYNFVFAGSMQLILSWIDNGQTISTDLLANRLDQLGHFCLLAIDEFKK